MTLILSRLKTIFVIMKILPLLLIIFLPGLFVQTSYGQEYTYPPIVNQAQIDYAKTKKVSRLASFTDTISLPFEDDFSRPGMEPFDSLWVENSGVYINSSFSSKPFTIGVATFDGLNQFGNPYNPFASDDEIGDILTCRHLDLTVPPGDTSVWLSFFYEPSGIGDPLETEDSLILQFKDTGNVWTTVWSVPGRSDTAFQRVNIRIVEDYYLFRGFQFRFYSIATVNGNRDHWNLDYVTLKKNTVGNAPILDNAMVRPQISMLSEFTAMPYSHFKAIGSQAMKTSIDDTLYNIDYGQTSYTPAAQIEQNGVSFFNASTFASTLVPDVYIPFSIPLTFTFPNQGTDSAEFLVKSYFSQAGIETNSYNDTNYLHQRFYNYYAYDDGSAERIYGVTGNTNVSIAYKFNVKIADTLRGVQIYFNPSGIDVSNTLFQLTVWSDINTTSNQSVELYRMINQKPDTFAGINGFKTYLFDTTLVIGPGNIWVGMIQNEPDVQYGVGLDKNTDSRTNMFTYIDGIWAQSTILGSWLMRPLFGKYIPLVSVEENQVKRINTFNIHPNPARQTFSISFNNSNYRNFTYTIYDCLGTRVKSESISATDKIDISDFSKGIYIVKIFADGYEHAAHKLIIQ